MTTTPSAADQVAVLFLQDINAPTTPGNILAVKTWLNAENSNPTLRNNPWNLHSWGGLPGQTGSDYVGSGDQNVAVFGTLQAGVQANANNLVNASKTYPEYGVAVDALRGNNPSGFLTAIAKSPWSASHYGYNAVTGTSKLSTAFQSAGGAFSSVQTVATTVTTGTLASFLGHDGTLTLQDAKTFSTTIAMATALVPGWPGGGEKSTDVYAYLSDFVGHKYSEIPLNLTDPSKKFSQGTGSTDPTKRSDNPLDIIPNVGEALVQVATYAIAVVFVVLGIWLYSKDRTSVPVEAIA